MTSDIHRYRFASSIAFEDIEANLILAIFAAESLHGECQVRLMLVTLSMLSRESV